MLKHMEDNADLNMLIDDAGSMLVICSKCKRLWTGKLELSESAASDKNIRQLINTAQAANPSFLEDFGIQ